MSITPTKYTDTRAFEAVQLPEATEENQKLLADWLGRRLGSIRPKYDGWCIFVGPYSEWFSPGDYLLRYSDGTIRPMAREEFEKYFKPAGEGWQDIATAPKDGSRNMFEMPSGMKEPEYHYEPLRFVRSDEPWCRELGGYWVDDQGEHITSTYTDSPTHWMPLPKGPNRTNPETASPANPRPAPGYPHVPPRSASPCGPRVDHAMAARCPACSPG